MVTVNHHNKIAEIKERWGNISRDPNHLFFEVCLSKFFISPNHQNLMKVELIAPKRGTIQCSIHWNTNRSENYNRLYTKCSILVNNSFCKLVFKITKQFLHFCCRLAYCLPSYLFFSTNPGDIPRRECVNATQQFINEQLVWLFI